MHLEQLIYQDSREMIYNQIIYIYRSEVISDYIKDVQDGIYHLFVLKADNAINTEFTDQKYSQNVTDLYPQQDKDNES